jgi:hypothetical protein
MDGLILESSGSDGSQYIATVKVDATGTGSNFVAASMISNGPQVLNAFRRGRYARTHSCLLETCGGWYATAQRPAPHWYRLHWWYRQKPLCCIVHYE